MEVRNSNEMQEQVLWAIDNVLDGRKFEQLCVDLWYRNGYQDIVPIEPQDGGRDAEELPRMGWTQRQSQWNWRHILSSSLRWT